MKINAEEAKELFPNVDAVTKIDTTEILIDTEIKLLMKKYSISLTVQNGVECLRVGSTSGKIAPLDGDKIRKYKPEIMVLLQTERQSELDKKENEKLQKAKELEALKSGTKKFKLTFYNGEPLSGYTTHGQMAELLEELKIAKYVSGWGTHISLKAKEALGTEFTYQQAVEYMQPVTDAKKKIEIAEKEKIDAIFETAKNTGEKQVLRGYTCNCNDPSEECSVDMVTEYAMPDGTIKTIRNHCW
jgi:hypothetical protein